MRVLLIAESCESKNGWSRYVSALSEALIATGDESRVLGWVSKQLVPQSTSSFSEFDLWSSFFKPWLLVRGGCKVREDLSGWKPELVHVMVEPHLLYGALIAFFYKIPLVMTVHGTYADPSGVLGGWKKLWVHQLFRFALSRCRQVICVSRFTEVFFLQRWPFMRGKTRVVTPGYTILPEGSVIERETFLSSCDLTPSRQPVLLVVGALKERRGQLEAVQALQRVRQVYSQARLLLVGSTYDTEYVHRVEEEVRLMGLSDAVTIRSDVKTDVELGYAYQGADILLMPSKTGKGRFEGFGLVALEANQFGKPVVAMAGSGVEDAVVSGETGVLVSPNDVDAFAKAVIQLVQQPLSPERIRKTLVMRTWAQAAAQIHSLYEHSLSSTH